MRLRNDLITHIVNVRFELIAHITRLPNHAVSVGHSDLFFIVLFNICLDKVDRSAFGKFKVGLLCLLLFLGLLATLLLLSFVCCGLLLFNLLYHLGRAQRDTAVNILLHIDTDLLLVPRRSLDGEGGNLLGNASRKIVLIGSFVVRCIDGEVTGTSKGNTTNDGEVGSTLKHYHGVGWDAATLRLAVNLHGTVSSIAIPRNLDGKGLVLDDFVREDLESRGENGGLESGATSDGLVGVHGGAKTIVGRRRI
mmetsp:Transcript_20869/g.45515  ORF Transcript_20869/g.45515 Transcript_20869/m.45515 type:complete len:251 (+) Transcript_20869:715-1467(+)